jgi:hypothetical protein
VKRLWVGLLVAVAPFSVSADQNELKLLTLQALKSPSGSAKSEILGPYAEVIRAKIQRADARVFAEVTTVTTFKQQGCKRLNVRIFTPGTLLPTSDGSSRILDIKAQMNMCLNGRPPDTEEFASNKE